MTPTLHQTESFRIAPKTVRAASSRLLRPVRCRRHVQAAVMSVLLWHCCTRMVRAASVGFPDWRLLLPDTQARRERAAFRWLHRDGPTAQRVRYLCLVVRWHLEHFDCRTNDLWLKGVRTRWDHEVVTEAAYRLLEDDPGMRRRYKLCEEVPEEEVIRAIRPCRATTPTPRLLHPLRRLQCQRRQHQQHDADLLEHLQLDRYARPERWPSRTPALRW